MKTITKKLNVQELAQMGYIFDPNDDDFYLKSMKGIIPVKITGIEEVSDGRYRAFYIRMFKGKPMKRTCYPASMIMKKTEVTYTVTYTFL